jgi:2-keto-3-deoxy-L-rhamnonate aldolase RhmA
MKNKTLELLKQNKTVIGFIVTIPSYDIAELLSKIGFDYLFFDLEHGSIGFESLPWLLSAASGGEATPLVRIPANDPVYAKLALDRGAQGIIIPQVDTKEDMEKAVRACKYPPDGIRGIGPRRPSLYYTNFVDYVKHANDEVLVMPLIESITAVNNIEEIASVKGVSALGLGPDDLSASMGYTYSLPKREKPVLEAIDRVLEVGKKFGIPVAMPGGGIEGTKEWIRKGCRMVHFGEDTDYMIKMKDDLAKLSVERNR